MTYKHPENHNSSRRIRRMKQDREFRALAKAFENGEVYETEYADPLDVLGVGIFGSGEPSTRNEFIDAVQGEVENYRRALALLSQDLIAVYDFIDEWDIRTDRPTSYARAQRRVVEDLKVKMSEQLHPQLAETYLSPTPESVPV